jgi:sensor histidine kinase regulating citrate/malate metabolism
MVLITLIVSISLVFRIEKESKKEIQTRLKLQQIELEVKQNNEMINITDNLRKLRHDMNNHIGLIKNLVYTQKYPELKEYVDQLYEDVERANDFVISENKTLTVLINTKKDKARELNIAFQSIITTSDITMQDKDICALLGNMLDNAIEAADKSIMKRFIDLSIQKTETSCVINCENSFGNSPMMKKGKFITDKDNSYLHGIGTENIKDVVAKYKGEVNFHFDDEVFSVRVVMPI